MLFRMRRSQFIVFAVIGCLAWSIMISFGEMRVQAQPTPTPPEHPATVAATAPNLGRHFKALGIEPFSQRTMDLVKDIMVFEQTPDYTLRAKTGWATKINPQIGWFVGYLEQNNNVYFFATNIDVRNPKDTAARIEVTRRSFKDLGLL